MKEKPIISDHILISYLNSDLSTEEREQVDAWLNADEQNKQELEKIEQVWSSAEHLQDFESIDLDRNWSALESKIAIDKGTNRTVIWRYAAAILLIAAASFLFWQSNKAPEMIHLTAENAMQVSLPDGSSVWLNAGSSLEYPEKFKGENRLVSLTGEGFFEVIHNPEKPFIVSSDQTTTQVLGTSFNIREGEGQLFELVLATGKVRFTSGENVETLLPGDKVMVDEFGQVRKTRNEGLNYMSWRTKRLSFNDTPMQDVVKDISRLYNVEIVIENEDFKDVPFTSTFQDESLEDVLETIELLFDIEFEQQGQKYRLIGDRD